MAQAEQVTRAVAFNEYDTKDQRYCVIYFRGFTVEDVLAFEKRQPYISRIAVGDDIVCDRMKIERLPDGVIAAIYERFDFVTLGDSYIKDKAGCWAEDMRQKYKLGPARLGHWMLEKFVRDW